MQYRALPGFDGYRISREGRLQSRWKVGGRVRLLEENWHDVGGWDDGQGYGYTRVGLIVPGKKRPIYKRIHQLVALAFIGENPGNLDVCHNDNDGSNSVVSNLRYDTRAGNFKDKIANGTTNRGSRAWNARLTEPIVREMFEWVAAGVPRAEVAEKFGIRREYLDAIIRREAWKHLKI